eukprot:TRINITY_DN17072_c0_g1_i2.p1 TRINITY_DN17072_c0_g1~~TRINITY_DN17072_c0_g1_i2.p1  ORF type:complete len:295 (-),score=56.92 TRINITY_DN17072_c0_g1_i2:146-1030(-)
MAQMSFLPMCGFGDLSACRPCFRGTNPWADATVKVRSDRIDAATSWRAVSVEAFDEVFSDANSPRREMEEEDACFQGYIEEQQEEPSPALHPVPPPALLMQVLDEADPFGFGGSGSACRSPPEPYEHAACDDSAASGELGSGDDKATIVLPSDLSSGSRMDTIPEASESREPPSVTSSARSSTSKVPAADTASELEAKAWIEQFLRRHGYASVNSKRTRLFKSKYALHTAVKQNSEEVVRLLLWAGADPALRNSSGLTPRQLAEKCNTSGSHDALLDALKAHEKPRSAARSAGA